jgi:hypothetical protein
MNISWKDTSLAKRESYRGSFPSIPVGERHLSGLTNMYHEPRVKFIYFRDKLAMM